MMKTRLLALVLCLTMLLGCSPRISEDAVSFYYLRNDVIYNDPAGIIAPEAQEIDPADNLLELFQAYISGPEDDTLHSPFPENIRILQAEQQGDAVTLEFNDRLATLTGMDLTLACACATMTCLELTDDKTVTIRAKGTTLDGADQITMDKESLLLIDSSSQLRRTQ